MSERMFPFWIISKPTRIPRVVLVTGDSRAHVAAFTSQERAIAFMQGADANWEFKLICRVTLDSLAEELRRFGVQGVCFEPDSKGCGDTTSFDELQRSLQMSSENLPEETEQSWRVPPRGRAAC